MPPPPPPGGGSAITATEPKPKRTAKKRINLLIKEFSDGRIEGFEHSRVCRERIRKAITKKGASS